MKNLTNNSLTEMSADELTGTLGGSFAFDAGRLTRALAIFASYGGAAGVGSQMAIIDFCTNIRNLSVEDSVNIYGGNTQPCLLPPIGLTIPLAYKAAPYLIELYIKHSLFLNF